MTDNRTTERFRELLTERGIEWRAGLAGSTIVGKWCFFEIGGKLAATTGYEPALTPEQAIAAAIGGGKLTAEQVREAIEKRFDFDVWVPPARWQAIAGELNATLGGGECEMYRDKHGTWHCKACENRADTNTGSDGALESWNDSWPPNFCPYCGAKAVKR